MIQILHGDCLAVLPTLPENSVDSVITDPPYHLTTGKKGGSGPASVNLESPYGRAKIGTGFMGMKWDGGDVAMRPETWAAVLRVAKPGAYLLAFGGTRTHHRIMCAIEDAGWEIRDMLMWVFGSGFPKSANGEWGGSALKPAYEPIIMARKPLQGTLASNFARWGTGGLDIDGCRINPGETIPGGGNGRASIPNGYGSGITRGEGTRAIVQPHDTGRWPANLIHDGSDEVVALFPVEAGAFAPVRGTEPSSPISNVYGARKRVGEATQDERYGDDGIGFQMLPGARRLDSGSAARFFYCPKADRADRNDGCDGIPERRVAVMNAMGDEPVGGIDPVSERFTTAKRNHHPTVKPTDLMRYLCRLVTPKGGTVLDPFMGSGSTLKAAELEGFAAIGIELEAEYIEIARRRIASDMPLFA